MGRPTFKIFCGILLHLANTVQAFPSVKINDSVIVGQTVTFSGQEANQYLGVPFAQPPIGPLRFKKPVPITSYSPEFKAMTNPPACLQYTTSPFPWYPNTTYKSEDCLYLNIWTPVEAGRTNKKAVMYWIYGGAHRYGAISAEIYNGTRLAIAGDIIVVTVNYRVGFFGFLTSNSEDAPGNLGVWDVLEGLRWVNKYIMEFGGDVSRITIAGESAGAIEVGFLAVSPLAKGLFTRQIVQSASPAYRRAENRTQSLAFSQQLAKYVGCANDTFTIDAYPKEVVKCLRGVEAERISMADYDFGPKVVSLLVPQWGDEILPDNPRVSVMSGNFRCTDLLIGNNKDEGSFQLTAFENQDLFGFFGEKNPHINRSTGESMIRKMAQSFPDPESIVDHYLPSNLTDDTDYGIRSQVSSAAGDMALVCPTVYYADECGKQKGSAVYYYFFTHRPSVSAWAPWMGTTHFEGVQFVFGKPVGHPEYQWSEYQLSRDIMDIWSSFVRDGKPSIPWSLYSRENRNFNYLGPEEDISVPGGKRPHFENCDFLRPSFEK